MDRQQIEHLLDRYFEGLTGLEEEKQLRDYFRREEIEEDFLPYQPLFRHFEEEKTLELSDDFDRQLEARLEQLSAGPTLQRRLWPTLARIAAVFLITFGLWWSIPQAEPAPRPSAIDWSKYEPETPEEAVRVTQMALRTLSGELRKGAATAAKEVDKVQEIGRYIK